MAISLLDIPDDVLYALAAVVSLPLESLVPDQHFDKYQPSPDWLNDQESRVTGLPSCLLQPASPRNVTVKVTQAAKRFLVAAAGGAPTLASRAAADGQRLEARLHPYATPTLLCYAHRKMHPSVVREIFFYLSKEVADNADYIRRHPRHNDGSGHDGHIDNDDNDDNDDNNDDDNDDDAHDVHSGCQSRAVRNWGYRMMGISALWSGRLVFDALEHSRQARSRDYRDSCLLPTTKQLRPGPPRLRSSMRMPHLLYPCEVCVLAAVGARSQALVDLRASMLSRMAEEATEKHRRDRKKKRGARGHAHAHPDRNHSFDYKRPKSFPHLWAIVEAYVNAFGADVASEIRRRSESLARKLCVVRLCERKRRKHRLVEQRRGRRETYHMWHRMPETRSARMVTRHGHRLPLPLLPADIDPWSRGPAVRRSGTSHGTAHDTAHDTNPVDPINGYLHDGQPFYYVEDDEGDATQAEHSTQAGHAIQAGQSTLVGHDTQVSRATKAVRTTQTVPAVQPRTNSTRLAPAALRDVPAWESDYQRHILESQSEASMSQQDIPIGLTVAAEARDSYTTISVHTEQPQRPFYPPPFYVRGHGLSPIPGTPISESRAPPPPPPRSRTTRLRSAPSSRMPGSEPRAPQPPRSTATWRRSTQSSPQQRSTQQGGVRPTSSIYSRSTNGRPYSTFHRPAASSIPAVPAVPAEHLSYVKRAPTVSTASQRMSKISNFSRPTAASASRTTSAQTRKTTTTTTAATQQTSPTTSPWNVPPSVPTVKPSVACPAPPSAPRPHSTRRKPVSGTGYAHPPPSPPPSEPTQLTPPTRPAVTKPASAIWPPPPTESGVCKPPLPRSFATNNKPPGRLSSLSLHTIAYDIYEAGNDTCSVLPDDSISVIVDNDYLAQLDAVERQRIEQLHEATKKEQHAAWLRGERDHGMPIVPTAATAARPLSRVPCGPRGSRDLSWLVPRQVPHEPATAARPLTRQVRPVAQVDLRTAPRARPPATRRLSGAPRPSARRRPPPLERVRDSNITRVTAWPH